MVIIMFKKIAILSLALFSTSVFATAKGNHHFPGIFVGATTIDDKTDFSYGLEYEYKFTRTFGAGFVMENTDDAHEGAGVEVKLVSAYFHPIHHVRLGLGFGEEKVNGSHGHPSHEEDLVRVSANYDFVVGDFEIAPTIAFDFVDGETSTVLGVAFIRPF